MEGVSSENSPSDIKNIQDKKERYGSGRGQIEKRMIDMIKKT